MEENNIENIDPNKPKFDPKKPYQPVSSKDKPEFDPSKPFEVVKKKDTSKPTSQPESTESVSETSSSDSPKYRLPGRDSVIPKDKAPKDLYTIDANTGNVNKKAVKTFNENSTVYDRQAKKLESQKELDSSIEKSIFSVNEEKIKEDLAKEANDNELTDYLREGGKNIANIAGGIYNIFPKTVNAISGNNLSLPTYEPYKKKVPFEDSIKQANDEVKEIQKKDPNFQLTDEQLQDRAKEIYIENLKQKQYTENAKDLLANQNPAVQERIKGKYIKSIADLSEKNKAISVQIQALDNKATPLRQSLIETKKLIDSGRADQATIDDYTQKQNDYNVIQNQYLKLLDDQNKTNKSKLTAEDRLKLFKLDYNPYHKALNDFITPSEKMIGEASYAMGKLDDKISEGFRNVGLESLNGTKEGEKNIFKEFGENTINDAEQKNAKFPTTSLDDIHSIGDFGSWVTQTIGTVAPYAIGSAIGTTEEQALSKAFLTPSKALGAFSVASAGGAMHEMDSDMAKDPSLNYNNWQYAGKIVGSVTSNAMMFGNYGNMLKGSQPLLETISKTPSANVEFKKGINDYLSKVFDTAKGMNKSGMIMAGSQAINMLVDNEILGKKHEGGFDELVNSYKEGFAMHGLISEMPKLGAYMIEKVVDNPAKKQIVQNLQKAYTISKELENTNLTTEEISSLQSKLKDAHKDNETILKSTLKQAQNLTKNQIKELLQIDQDKFAINKEVEDLKKGNFSRDYKEQVIKEKNQEFRDLEKRRTDVFENEHNALSLLDKSEQNRLEKQAKENIISDKKLDPSKELNIDPKEIKDEALKIHLKELKEEEKINEIPQETVAETKQKAQPKAEEQKEEQEGIVDSEGTNDIDNKNERETTPTDTANGNVPVADNSKELQGKNNELQSSTDSGNDKGEIEHEYKLTEKGKTYKVKLVDGKYEVSNEKGESVSKPTERKVLRKHSEKIDFTKGETVSDKEDFNPHNYEEEILSNSENPSEIATAIEYSNKDKVNSMSKEETRDYITQTIMDGLSKIKESGFNRFGDRNKKTKKTAKEYFDENGRDIDDLAMEMSETAGVEITPNDIADFIMENPDGIKSIKTNEKKAFLEDNVEWNNKIESLKKKFTELTGLPANKEFLSLAKEKGDEKNYRLQNEEILHHYSDADLLSLSKEYEQFKEYENGRTEENDGSSKTVSDNENKETSGEESGVQKDGRGEISPEEGGNGKREQEGAEQGNEAGRSEGINEKSTIDQISNWLDEVEKNIDKFGKENLSAVVLPVAVAKVAIQAMRVAIQAGKLAHEIIQEGIDAVKQSNWFKSLNSEDQKEVEKDFLKKLSGGDRQTENILNRSISDRVTEDEAYVKFNETADQSRKELENKKPLKQFFKEQYKKFVTRFSDRQYVAKRLLDKAELENTKNLIINSHGASGKARKMFEKAYDTIYRKLNREDRITLDKIIQAKRFISIDENREARGLEPVSHPNFIDKNISQKFLDKLRKEIGDEKMDDLENRANHYFKTYKDLLTQMYDNGLISKESFDSLDNVDYQPKVYLKFLTDFNGDIETNKKTNNLDSGGLSEDQIKSMSEGDASNLVMNSEYLLTNSLLARTKAMANNNVNKRFMTDEFPKAKKRFDALDPNNLKGDDVRFYKYFKELESKVIDNPITGSTDAGNLKYKFDKAPMNFAKMYYYVDGVQHQFFLEKNLHESWNDNIGGILSSDSKEFLSYASGSALVKGIATGNNPAFPIVNTPRDFLFTVAFSDQYSKIVPKAMLQVGKDVVKAIIEIKKPSSDILEKYFEYGGAMDFLSSQGVLKKDSVVGKTIDKLVSPNVRDISKSIFSAVTLHKISAYSEMMFRLGIFQRSIKNQLSELGFKDISEVTDKQQVEDIYNSAVASARGIMDFNQGGYIAKDVESVIPYLNASIQGGRVAISAFEKDPVGTTSRVLQLSTIASSVPIGLSLGAIAWNKSDDDKRSNYEIYIHALDGISQYQKSKYMNIVTGIKDADGEYQIIKVAKSQELSPIMSLTDNIYSNMIRKMAGQEKRSSSMVISDALFAFNSNVMPIDVTSPAGMFTRNPLAKATLTYATGYDFFREQPLSMKLEKKPSPTEGMDMKNVEDFYKKLGVNYGLSPVRSKAFVESLITSPDTNPFVGFLYGGADAVSSDKSAKEIGKKLGSDLYRSVGKRVVGYTSDFNRQLETSKVLQDKIEQIKLKSAIQKAEFNDLAKRYIAKELPKAELNAKLEKLDPNDRKHFFNKLKDKMHLKGVDNSIIDIKYEQNSEAKALMIMHYYGDIFDGSEDSKKILIQMRKAKGVLTKDVKYEYFKLRKEIGNEKRPN